ncbi:hypothetical protein [Modestobacter versicolor]|uniref:Uncharacterized protein n=1 Tax=Modestobacter versicolor TaxID=429133 RepID=A0A323VIF0_9ACTN|nr:hypothetical protein [Modestobacter versicolor]MBB3675863.1 hypothetical protein [Modestobacter versicolor]PZA22816.1 hypothetical protein DMO24_03250 [Modestobacter versicolor]
MPFLSRRTTEVAPLPFDPRSPEGLAARWVQWVAAARADKNPIADETGEDAAANQPSDVFFLAGSYGERLVRRCVVPAGRDLFIPAFCNFERNPDGPPQPIESAHGSIAVDGAPLEADWISTPVPFLVSGARLNLMTGRTKPVPMTTWGLWKLIPALPQGQHEVHAVGGDGHGFVVDVRYELLVNAPSSVPWV